MRSDVVVIASKGSQDSNEPRPGRAIIVREPDPAWHLTPQNDQLMSECRILCFKPVLPPNGKGRFAVTKTVSDEYVPRTPLRNIELTPPYFHSGRVWDLNQAVGIMASRA